MLKTLQAALLSLAVAITMGMPAFAATPGGTTQVSAASATAHIAKAKKKVKKANRKYHRKHHKAKPARKARKK